jgi:hypothetical protein
MNPIINNGYRYLAYLIIALTSISYALTIILYAQNIPIYDDFLDGILFITEYKSTDDIFDRITIIFSQYNQHRIATNRIVYSIIYELTGTINFYAVTIIGNINVFILAVIYCLYARKHTTSWFLPAACCALLFHISCFHTALWPMTVLSNYSVLGFSLLTLYFLDRGTKWSFYVALLCSVFTVFSLRSGQLILPCGLMLIVLNNIKNEKSLLNFQFYIWFIYSIAIVYFFYSDFEKVDQTHEQFQMLTNNTVYTATAGLALLGSPFAFEHEILSIFAGALSLITFFYLAYKKSWRNSAIFCYCCFLLLVLAVLTFSRSWVGIEVLIKIERYRFVAFNYWICLLLLLSCTFKSNNEYRYIAITFLALSFSISTFLIKGAALINYTKNKEQGIVEWADKGKSRGLKKPVLATLVIPAEVSLQKLYDEGVYIPTTHRIEQ